MWLLDTTARPLTLREFVGEGNIPDYAILSHTWREEEVLFADVRAGTYSSKKGLAKVTACCAVAAAQGFEWAWIDTCCIDKSSSAELSEAINSMFQWYKQSKICYAFLDDLSTSDTFESIRNCRWIERGWTLQDLIAPGEVEFYDNAWAYRGKRSEHAVLLEKITGIPERVLLDREELPIYCIARRMSWAAHRKTTRTEDMAYCLLGIFDIHMPPLYGEGPKAFLRLQEEILRRSNDLTLFLWGEEEAAAQRWSPVVFAESVTNFKNSGTIYSLDRFSPSVSVTNRGLLVSGVPLKVVQSGPSHARRYMLCIGKAQTSFNNFPMLEGLILFKISPGVFFRCGRGRLLVSDDLADFAMTTGTIQSFWEVETIEYDSCILYDSHDVVYHTIQYRAGGIQVPDLPVLVITKATPHSLWDEAHRIFLCPRPSRSYLPIPQVLGLEVIYVVSGTPFEFYVFCDISQPNSPGCMIYAAEHCPRKLRRAFHQAHIANSIVWHEVLGDDQEGAGECGPESVQIGLGSQNFRLCVSLEYGPVIVERSEVPPLEFPGFSLQFVLEEI